jgi:Zn-dependent alcohol dehydrogenase
LKEQPFDVEKGITHHYPLAQIGEAFDEADLTPRLKTIITFEG